MWKLDHICIPQLYGLYTARTAGASSRGAHATVSAGIVIELVDGKNLQDVEQVCTWLLVLFHRMVRSSRKSLTPTLSRVCASSCSSPRFSLVRHRFVAC